jgi:flagellar hook-associated protein 2
MRTGTLAGDSNLLSIESRVLGVINTPPSPATGSYNYLTEIGVSIQKDGTMALDSTALGKALGSNFSDVANLFASNDQGYAYRLQNVAKDMLATDGLIDSRTTGLQASIASLKNDEDRLSTRLTVIEARYRSQFTALDAMLGSMNTTSTFLSQQLGNLPGFR